MRRIDRLRTDFLAYAERRLPQGEPVGLYEPAAYLLRQSGKRVRPLLALLGASLFEESAGSALPVALAVEVFHNFTLVHDDIMDASPLRRGEPTVHAAYGENTAILAGDLLLIKAYEAMSELRDPTALPAIIRVFNRVAVGVCEGQQLDVDFETREDVTIAEYLRMIELKTAVLLGGALQMGALAAGAGEAAAAHLYEFGRLTGIAFQLQDDYLDTFGEAAAVGKQIGNDITTNKKTFLYLRSLELAAPAQRTELEQHYALTGENAAKVSRVTQLMHELEIPRRAAKLRDDYQARAYDALAKVTAAHPERKQDLIDLAEALLQRES
ncbi:MAG: polyprenyl synthetase family protein [Saprospiraceae bacterium]